MTHTNEFYPETWIKEYEFQKMEDETYKYRIDIDKIASEYARKITKQIDKLTLHKIPMEALRELKKQVDKEIEWRENLTKWYSFNKESEG